MTMSFSDEAEHNLRRCYADLQGTETYSNIVSALRTIEETPVEYALTLIPLSTPQGWESWTGDFVRYLDNESESPNASIVFRYNIVDVDLVDSHIVMLSWTGLEIA